MPNKRFKPKIDGLFYAILIPTLLLLVGATILSLAAPAALLIVIPVDIITLYFIISPVFGYVELRESTVFIKLGFFMKIEIPYTKIRGAERARKLYSDSFSSLKNSLEHVNIKYNTFDVLTVSVVDNNELLRELSLRVGYKL